MYSFRTNFFNLFKASLKPNLNIESFARSTRYAQPFGRSLERKQKRSKLTHVYDRAQVLLYTFETGQALYKTMTMHHTSLKKHLDKATFYLNVFRFSSQATDAVPRFEN
jgi:hypothetical protein